MAQGEPFYYAEQSAKERAYAQQNSLGNAAGQIDKSSPQVTRELQSLNCEAEALRDSFTGLEDRLKGIVDTNPSPQVPNAAGGRPPEQPLVPVAEAIRDICRKVTETRIRIEFLRSRIEL